MKNHPFRSDVEEAIKKMHKHSSQGTTPIHQRLSMVALEEALLHLRLATLSGGAAAMDPRIADIPLYMQHSFAEKISLPDLAKRSCLSTSRLSHLFKEEVGDTIINTLHKIRLEKAAQLLSYTARQISKRKRDELLS
ncbi:hypothetical protein ACFFK0_23155 [Paenibacillus chartarius]|uniref:HTH araC/xylS-type domain-containing protein n=1 Tax=Paenibacillus chartarius TaxID=747481 RepID=A0ABV6DRL6_9BACL